MNLFLYYFQLALYQINNEVTGTHKEGTWNNYFKQFGQKVHQQSPVELNTDHKEIYIICMNNENTRFKGEYTLQVDWDV